ncbi:MAG TPA: hypothetical protein VII06_26845 [Chloroflexota bacterium]|jgi:hypothetical protein
MNRISIPMILPLAATMVAVLIIVSIGSLLLTIAEQAGYTVGREQGEYLAVATALVIAGAILFGCYLASRGGTEESHPHH